MMRAVQFVLAGSLSLGTVFFGGCETVPQGIQQARIEMSQRIVAEPAGDYFIGRRYYKPDYKFWGYIRRPGQPWSGDKVYEPASNGIYPEFVLKGYELISTNPPPIFKSQFRGNARPTDLRYVVEKPE